MKKKRLVVGLSGASGAPLAVELLATLQNMSDWETHLVYTNSFEETLKIETQLTIRELSSKATKVYDINNMGSSISSGTFQTEGMIIVPCSMKTLAGVTYGYSDNLLLRAADVTIKERRKLVLVTRETPLNPIHLKNMLYLAERGIVLLPPMLTYYNNPQSVHEMTRHIIGKMLDIFNIQAPDFKRWE